MLRPLAALAVLGALALAGCTSAPENVETTGGGASVEAGGASANAGNGTASANAGNASANAGNGTASAQAGGARVAARAPVDLAVGTVGQWPVNPGFDPAALSAPSGAPVNLTLNYGDTIPGLASHNIVIDGVPGAETDTISAGSTSAMFTAPAPGEYEYYCAVGDHRDRGMVGVLTVT